MFFVYCLRTFKAVSFSLIFLLFFSCMGAASQVTLASDGSGSILLEYRISSELENLGRLDGNQSRLPVPTGRIDLERSVARISGLSLVSYTSLEDGHDIVHRTELAFSSPQALSAFFNSASEQFKIDFPGRKIIISFFETETMDSSFKEFAVGILQGYEFSISFTVPGNVSAEWIDGNGTITNHFPGNCFILGTTVQYTAAIAELVFLESPLFLEISW